MENIIKDAIIELDEVEGEDDWTDYDYKPITEEEMQFADDIFNMLQTEVDKASELTEEFTGKQSENNHFNSHCIGKNKDKKSRRSHVYYDFRDVSQYVEHEKHLNALMHDPDVKIAALLDTELVLESFANLFKGNYSILFCTPCGLHNERGPVMLAIRSFATSSTTNYTENTVDFMILTPKYKTITLYPVSADYVETKFNNIIKKYTTLNIEFKINSED